MIKHSRYSGDIYNSEIITSFKEYTRIDGSNNSLCMDKSTYNVLLIALQFAELSSRQIGSIECKKEKRGKVTK